MTEKSAKGVEATAEAAGLQMSKARAAEVAAEAERIRAGVKRATAPHFGFYDEPIHFLAALEDCAEDGA